MRTVIPYGLFLLVFITACEPCPHYRRLEVAAFSGPEKVDKSARKPYGTIQPYEKVEDIGRPYKVIGFMSCEGSAAEEAAILKAMLYRAADMGADGILLNPNKVGAEDVKGESINVQMGLWGMIGSGNRRAYRAQAIKFK